MTAQQHGEGHANDGGNVRLITSALMSYAKQPKRTHLEIGLCWKHFCIFQLLAHVEKDSQLLMYLQLLHRCLKHVV